MNDDFWFPTSDFPIDLTPESRPISAPPLLETKDSFGPYNLDHNKKLIFAPGVTEEVGQESFPKYYAVRQQKPNPPPPMSPFFHPVPQQHMALPVTPINRFLPNNGYMFEQEFKDPSFQDFDNVSGESSEEEPSTSPAPRSFHPRSFSRQTPTAAMDIHKGSPVWRPLPSRRRFQERSRTPGRQRSETPLSSSADELLTLASTKYLLRGSVEESDEDPFLESERQPRRPIQVSSVPKKEFEKAAKSAVSDLPSAFHNQQNQEDDQDGSDEGNQNVICRYFSAGYCSRGDRCNYIHAAEIPVAVVPKAPKSPTFPPVAQYTRVSDYINEIYTLCLDQHGCRFLQRELDIGGPAEVLIVFNGVIKHIIDLMKDPFGNYLCQKLVEHCTVDQRLEIVKGISANVVQISKNMHGTRAIQRLIEKLESAEEIKIIRDSLKGSVVSLIQDLNGNHVIQKCLHKMEPNDNQFIYDAVAEHCVQVATHRHGCCVLQRCIDHGTIGQQMQLVEQIQRHGTVLVQDPFGNYVVQYALDLHVPGLAYNLMVQLEGQLYKISRQKFSSNVVEKCLKSGDPFCVKRVMRELLLESPDPHSDPFTIQPLEKAQGLLLDLLQDSYGNYVVQTCLSEGIIHAHREYSIMVSLIVPFVNELRHTPHMKRIYHLLNLQPQRPPPNTRGGTRGGPPTSQIQARNNRGSIYQ